MRKRILHAACAVTSILFSSCISTQPAATNDTAPKQPKAMTEFRAAWVATVANINWPSKPGITTAQQKLEATALLDFLKEHNFNAVIFQVRPQADALYKSDLEPWSYYLTGTQGKAPDPYYDPLEFWIEAAHDRGIELHVWLNPYRAHHKDGKEISDKSIIKTKPGIVVYLKEGYWWMDPSKKETQDHTTAVVMDIVKRYDIDGVHFDDYFYPYPSYNLNEDFPDSTSWAAYQHSGGKLSRGDWRRESVNKLISRLYKDIKVEKPYVKFGLSPFGIWRPGYPESIEGFDQYNQLYADAKLWLNKGWIDYFSPQLYWGIKRYPQNFPELLGWWAGENTKKRHLWPGISVGARDTSDRNIDETLNQIMISRGMLPASKGIVHWSISSLIRNPKMAKSILDGPYKKNALVPPSPWLDNKAPESPSGTASLNGDSVRINWSHPNEKDVFRWVVYYQYGTSWNYQILDRKTRELLIKRSAGNDPLKQESLSKILVSAVDRVGNESAQRELTWR